jgi:Ca2+:H+ antiporter
LAALVTLTLVLPNFTTSAAGPLYATSQLIFAGIVSLVLYGAFVFVQTVRHRGYFLSDSEEDEVHGAPPSGPAALGSLALLIISLVAVVALAKALTPTVEAGIDRFGAPKAVVGVIIAALVLLPESLAAMRAARLNRLQT